MYLISTFVTFTLYSTMTKHLSQVVTKLLLKLILFLIFVILKYNNYFKSLKTNQNIFLLILVFTETYLKRCEGRERCTYLRGIKGFFKVFGNNQVRKISKQGTCSKRNMGL